MAHNSASPASSPLASSTTEKQARSSRGSPTAYGDAGPAGIGRHGRESACVRVAMSLYTHVRNKNDLLDGMADAVISQIPVSAEGADWKASLRQLALAARSVMLRHPWAPRTVEAQAAPGPAALHYVNAVLGILREGGFSIAQTHHALHILGSRLLGFTQALFDDSGDLEPQAAAALASALGASHPYVVEMALAVTHDGALGRCDDDAEFEFALDFILDGLARLHSG